MIVQRARLGQLLVAGGSVVVLVTFLLIGATSLALSTSAVSDAAPEILLIDEVHDEVVAELTATIPAIYPPGAVTPETAALVAERMVRDSGFVEGTRPAAAVAHQEWLDGGDPRPTLENDVLAPAALAAFRDVDLDLAREFPADVVMSPTVIEVPVTTSASSISRVRSLAVGALVGGLVAIGVGTVLDRRIDRTLRWASHAMLGVGIVLGVAAVVLPLLDLTSSGWSLPTLAALVGVSRTPILIAAGASILLGAFLRASASQVAPLVENRERQRALDAAGPRPASSGTQTSRRRGRAVRQQAIDAFFDEDADDATTIADEPQAPVEQPLVAYQGDGFDQAIAAVEADPSGGTPPPEDTDGSDEAAAADRREALERIDGARSRLRTHLPR